MFKWVVRGQLLYFRKLQQAKTAFYGLLPWTQLLTFQDLYLKRMHFRKTHLLHIDNYQHVSAVLATIIRVSQRIAINYAINGSSA
jgi:hypothetical protein